MSLLQMSVQGGVLILVVAAVRAGTKNRLPRSTFFVLWLVAIARLLIPFSMPSGYSAYTAAERSPVLRGNLAPVLRAPSAGGASDVRNVFIPWGVLWAAGAIVLTLYFITGYLHFWKKYRFSLPVKDTFSIQWMREHPLRRKVSLRQSDMVSAPLTYGILRPVILLPKNTDWSDIGQLQYILAHEMTHIRHFDTVWKLLATAALCLHWFNPMAWILCVLLGRDLELLCDECVVKQFGEPSRPAYAMTLIRMEERKSGLLPFGSHFSKTAIEERITAIMRAKKASIAAVLAAIVLVVGISTVFATSAAASTQMVPEDVKLLKRFQFPGWENMSVAEFQERAWTILDEPQMQKWYQKIEHIDEYYTLKDDDPMCHFLYSVLNELTAEAWQARAHGGAAVTDFPAASDQAMLEYFFNIEVLDRNRLTVGEYCTAVEGVHADMQPLLQNLELDTLKNQAFMSVWLEEKMTDIYEKWSSDSLRVSSVEYCYAPFSSLYDENGNRIQEETEGFNRISDRNEEGKRSNIDLSEYREQELEEAEVERRDYPPATQSDYDSLMELKTADYQSLTLEKFNQRLLAWANENYDRMERISISTDLGDVENTNLTDEERAFVTLSVRMSGAENGMMVRSLYTGQPEEDPSFTGGDFIKQTAVEGRGAAWCGLYYQFSYHIADRAAVTVGERDNCVGGFLNTVQRFWDETPLEELLKVEKADIVSTLQQLAAQNSTKNVLISTNPESIGFDRMDERGIR